MIRVILILKIRSNFIDGSDRVSIFRQDSYV